jgi:hypothetical protein
MCYHVLLCVAKPIFSMYNMVKVCVTKIFRVCHGGKVKAKLFKVYINTV